MPSHGAPKHGNDNSPLNTLMGVEGAILRLGQVQPASTD